MTGCTLDAGALIALERGDRRVALILAEALAERLALVVPAGALAQAWRNGARQARLARLIASPQVEVEPLDSRRARAAGQLCGVTGTRDVIDASVVLCARTRGTVVLTSDPEDLQRLDRQLSLIRV